MKRFYTLLLALIFTGLGFGQVFITEIADPNNNDAARFVELYNAGGTSVDLSNWGLRRWTNGNTASQSDKSLSGVIPAGGFIIFAKNSVNFSSTFTSYSGTVINLGSGGPADSNGDDQIALIDHTNSIVDIFGVPGQDGSGTCHEFEDGRVERVATITSGNPIWDESEWNVWADSTTNGCTNHTKDPQNAPGDFDPGVWIGAGASGPANPDAFSAVAISSSEIDLMYDDNLAADDVVIVFNTDNVFDTPSGTPTATNFFGDDEILFVGNTSGTFNHTGLTENTTYYYKAYSYDGSDYSSGLDDNDTTPCSAIAVTNLSPFQEGFEAGVPPSCWTSFGGTNNLGIAEEWGSDTDSNTGSNAAFVSWENADGNTTEDWLVTRPLDLTSLTDSELSFFTKDDISSDYSSSYAIRISTSSQTDHATFTTVETYTESELGNSYNLKTIDLSAYDGESAVYIAFVLTQDDGDGWYLDDIEVKQSTSKNANIIAAGFTEPENINYIAYDAMSGLNVSNAIKVGEFTIQDAGEAPLDTDNLSTTLDDLTFMVVGADNIAALAIIDSDLPMDPFAEVTNVSASTTFSNLGIIAPDDGSKSFSLYATFKSSVTDNDQIQLSISAATADSAGSTFADEDAGGATTSIAGDANRIEVTATQLFIDTNTSNVEVNTVMSPSPTVTAIDGEANTDLDPLTITLTPSVADIYGTTASFVKATVSGTATFDNLSFDTVGTGYTLTASSGALNTDTSSAFDVTGAVIAGGATELFFSEYIEGGSNNKCLEIYNGTGADIDLSTYEIKIYANGNTSPSNTISLSGTLVDGDVYVVCDNSSAAAFLAVADLANNGSFFNGNDAVTLENSSIIVDVIGNIGCDPGSYWSSASNDTKDHTLVRNASVCGGVTIDPSNSPCDFPTLESEWTQFAKDDVSNLGSHTANCSVAPPSCNTFAGNGLTGFGGTLGTGSLEVCAISGTTIDFTYTRGSDDFNDFMVIYIDTQSGGITNTANLTDTGDDGRKAISGFDGGSRSTLDFPPGFEPDFAISMNNGFAGLFEIVESGSHTYIQSALLSPTATNNAATYTFNIDFANVNTTPSAESLKLLATYINPAGAFRSNEAIGRMNTVGNPGANPVGMDTYYQSNSGLQGGIAPSTADGLWSDNATWPNGNAPLKGDEVLINNTINQDTDYTAGAIEVTGSNTLTIDSGTTLSITGGIEGTGNLNIDGKLIITEGGSTDIVPTYGSGSTLEYRNILAAYNRFNEWSNGTALGAGVPDNVIIENATLDLTNSGQSDFVNFTVGSALSLLTNGNLTIDANESLSLGGDFSNAGGSLDLNSESDDYSSLIVDGTSTGNVIYRRHVNSLASTNTVTGDNDLISAPVTNASQTFGVFSEANANIPSGTVGGGPTTFYLFGPFDNTNATHPYTLYSDANDGDAITAGVGYRTASTDTSTFTFVGDVETGTVPVGINVGSAFQWNLIGNPYPSYINSGTFLIENAEFLDDNAVGIYGYDGLANANGGWTIINFNTISAVKNIAPGQGFLVAAAGTSTLNFTPTMREVLGTDDFILGRTSDNKFISLKIENNSTSYHTDFYFNDNSTRALDPGYDAAVFDVNSASLFIYSHLVENNEGRSMAIQSFNRTDLTDITIPLGVKANQGHQITFSIDNSTLPNTVEVYLEDNVTNTFTLLTNSDYAFTPNTDISGTGRFFLRFADSALSTVDDTFETLSIYTNDTDKTIVIAGQLLEATTAKVYDLQGRLVAEAQLETSKTSQSIDARTLSTGVYVIQLSSVSKRKSQKLIIR